MPPHTTTPDQDCTATVWLLVFYFFYYLCYTLPEQVQKVKCFGSQDNDIFFMFKICELTCSPCQLSSFLNFLFVSLVFSSLLNFFKLSCPVFTCIFKFQAQFSLVFFKNQTPCLKGCFYPTKNLLWEKIVIYF